MSTKQGSGNFLGTFLSDLALVPVNVL